MALSAMSCDRFAAVAHMLPDGIAAGRFSDKTAAYSVPIRTYIEYGEILIHPIIELFGPTAPFLLFRLLKTGDKYDHQTAYWEYPTHVYGE